MCVFCVCTHVRTAAKKNISKEGGKVLAMIHDNKKKNNFRENKNKNNNKHQSTFLAFSRKTVSPVLSLKLSPYQ